MMGGLEQSISAKSRFEVRLSSIIVKRAKKACHLGGQRYFSKVIGGVGITIPSIMPFRINITVRDSPEHVHHRWISFCSSPKLPNKNGVRFRLHNGFLAWLQ